MAKHKPALDARSRIDALREELHKLYADTEKTGATVRRMGEIVGEISEIREAEWSAKPSS